MSYAIMRTKKLKMGGAAASLMHTFRERDTPNADPDRADQNINLVAQSSDDAMGRMRKILPEKFRKDAVVAIEYLLTTSPEWAEKATPKQQRDYWNRSIDWITEKHGQENVFVVSVHRDETTPHQVVYVVPMTKDGRLCAKDFLGGRQKLRNMQTDFAEAVQDLGLKRGIEGSKAKHQRVSRHYGQVHKDPAEVKLAMLKPADLKPQKRGAFKSESPAEVANRINKDLIIRTNNNIKPLIAKVNEREAAVEQAKLARATAEKFQDESKALRLLTAGLSHDDVLELKAITDQMRIKNEQKRAQKIENDRKIQASQKVELDKKRAQKPSQGPKL